MNLINSQRSPVGLRGMVIFSAVMVTALALPAEAAEIVFPSEKALVTPANHRQLSQRDIELILVPPESPSLLAVVTPALAMLRQGENQPLLLAASDSPGLATAALISRLKPGRTLLLSANPGNDRPSPPTGQQTSILQTGSQPARASRLIAKTFWTRSEEAVLVSGEDPEAMIFGSALAAHRAIPLIVHDGLREHAALTDTLRELQVGRVLLAAGAADADRDWQQTLELEVERLDRDTLEHRLAAEAAREGANALVLARSPGEAEPEEQAVAPRLHGSEGNGSVGATAWLAPYYSLVRRAPVVLTSSSDAEEATSQVMRLIERQNLRPRSLAILADDDSLGTTRVQIPTGKNEDSTRPRHSPDQEREVEESAYSVAVEPCMPKRFDEIPAFGVGRIPFRSIERAATFLTRGFARDRLLADSEPRAMLAANAALDDRELPLSETMARLSALEFENVDLAIEEFYGTSIRSFAARKAARRANLILYHGHTGHERFLPDAVEAQDGLGSRHGYPGQMSSLMGDLDCPPRDQLNEMPSERLIGLPVVVLQSCSSLKKPMLDRLHRSDGVAMIGSVTSIHSASGTAFIKAVADGFLYRGDALGEALRDARAYFFLLQQLKDSREHTEQAKSQRVALSFRLWGDPALRVFPQGVDAPHREPPKLEPLTSDPGVLQLSMPEDGVERVRTERYFARAFPNSQLAGIVKRKKSRDARRVAPLHFFRLPLRGRSDIDPSAELRPPGDKSAESFFGVDGLRRYLYVLYYPEKKEERDQTIRLRFTNGGDDGSS